ncbi:MAG: class I tRNA ligase family protein, partial [Nitriliruptorales bacterium]|nr:class I tRNA ligase family protein [Nitriliruptorales bacterium]
VLEYLEEGYQPDALRYATAANLPEYTDTDISEAELIRRINDELANDWGNLVNRVFAMTHKNFAGTVPDPGELEEPDTTLLDTVDGHLAAAADLLEKVELRAALKEALAAAQATNAYLNRMEPWKTAKTDRERTGRTLYTALQAIDGIAIAFAPYTPNSSDTILGLLGHEGGAQAHGWQRREVTPGTELGEAQPLFQKIDLPD